MSLTVAETERIVHLWTLRGQSLSSAEITELCQLVQRLLVRTRLPAQYADAQARAELIHDFLVQKVILNPTGTIESAFVLHGYLKNYATDQLRKADRAKPFDDSVAIASNDDDEEAEQGGADIADATDLVANQNRLLAEAGIDIETARTSARRFLDALEAAEKAYLELNTCNDGESASPISSIAERLCLGSSYHYKAKQLGITGRKGGFYQGYEQTKIGKWLTSLGAKINTEWRGELLALLTILCSQLLAHGETDWS